MYRRVPFAKQLCLSNIIAKSTPLTSSLLPQALLSCHYNVIVGAMMCWMGTLRTLCTNVQLAPYHGSLELWIKGPYGPHAGASFLHVGHAIEGDLECLCLCSPHTELVEVVN